MPKKLSSQPKYSLDLFRTRLNNSMKINEMSVMDLSKKLNCSKQLIYNWRNGKTAPTLDYMIKLSEIFKVSIEWLSGSDEYIESGDVPVELNKTPSILFTYNGKLVHRTLNDILNRVLSSVAESLLDNEKI